MRTYASSWVKRKSIYRKSEHQMFLLISGSHTGAAKRFTNMASPVPGDIHSSMYREKNDLVVVLACYITQAWKSKGLIVTVMPLLNTWRWNCTLHQQLQLFTALLCEKLTNLLPPSSFMISTICLNTSQFPLVGYWSWVTSIFMWLTISWSYGG